MYCTTRLKIGRTSICEPLILLWSIGPFAQPFQRPPKPLQYWPSKGPHFLLHISDIEPIEDQHSHSLNLWLEPLCLLRTIRGHQAQSHFAFLLGPLSWGLPSKGSQQQDLSPCGLKGPQGPPCCFIRTLSSHGPQRVLIKTERFTSPPCFPLPCIREPNAKMGEGYPSFIYREEGTNWQGPSVIPCVGILRAEIRHLFPAFLIDKTYLEGLFRRIKVGIATYQSKG